MTHLQKIFAHATFRRHLLALLAVPLFAGCASIVGQDTERLPITSTPDDAQILIIDEAGRTAYRGRTPDKVALPKSDGRYWGGKQFTVAISKAGYLTQRVRVDTRPNPFYLGGNWLFGGLIGWLIVDPTSGRMYELSSDGIQVTLQKIPAAAQASLPPETPPKEMADAPSPTPTSPPAVASSAVDLRPALPPPASAPAPNAPPRAMSPPAPTVADPATLTAPSSPAETPATTPSIFVPERPPGSTQAWAPVTPSTADTPAPAAPTPPREPPPYWPPPPPLPVSPSTTLPASLNLAQR